MSTIGQLAKQAACKQAVDTSLKSMALGGLAGGLGGYILTPFEENYEKERKKKIKNTLAGVLAGAASVPAYNTIRDALKPVEQLPEVKTEPEVKRPTPIPAENINIPPDIHYATPRTDPKAPSSLYNTYVTNGVNPAYKSFREDVFPVLRSGASFAGDVVKWNYGNLAFWRRPMPRIEQEEQARRELQRQERTW